MLCPGREFQSVPFTACRNTCIPAHLYVLGPRHRSAEAGNAEEDSMKRANAQRMCPPHPWLLIAGCLGSPRCGHLQHSRLPLRPPGGRRGGGPAPRTAAPRSRTPAAAPEPWIRLLTNAMFPSQLCVHERVTHPKCV